MESGAVIGTAVTGFGLGAGLIVAIGAQNAHVLRQGLRRQHVLAVASVCSIADAVLIAAGAAGFGGLVARSPALTAVAAWGGAVFLFGYGVRAFRSAWRPAALIAGRGDDAVGLRPVLLVTLALTFLNPHVYLDTVVLLGSIAAQYGPGERAIFAGGAAAASFLWFFGLGFGASRLAPVFARPGAWRVLDAAIGCVMWAIAIGLVAPQLRGP